MRRRKRGAAGQIPLSRFTGVGWGEGKAAIPTVKRASSGAIARRKTDVFDALWRKLEKGIAFTRLPGGLSLAAFRSQYRAYDTPSRFGAWSVPPLSAFPSVHALGSACGCPALFVGFTATVAECDFSRLFVAGYGSSPSRHGRRGRPARCEISGFPTYRESLRTCQGLRPRRGPDCLPPTPTFKAAHYP